ncbi:uncharacterized protein [Montipora foliosa]|uniref:uncharacterized protein n=1 Tax=Montipora foliosa TaxID=591990 RepID=UPI0035F1613C
MTDNGPPFSSKEFAAFANQYRFGHITSSPRYPQSNGFIEHMVQTVEQSMRKCAATGHDPNLAMLVYRAAPLTTSIPSPAQLLNGRKYRALLPIRSPIQNPHCQLVREQMVKDKDKMCEHYNKTARIYLHCHRIRESTYNTPGVTSGLQQLLPKRQLRLNRDRTMSKLLMEALTTAFASKLRHVHAQ